jgi:hypothetical protein
MLVLFLKLCGAGSGTASSLGARGAAQTLTLTAIMLLSKRARSLQRAGRHGNCRLVSRVWSDRGRDVWRSTVPILEHLALHAVGPDCHIGGVVARGCIGHVGGVAWSSLSPFGNTMESVNECQRRKRGG